MTAYYNEIDASAAAWLRELIRRNLIAPGDVDERSIADVSAADIRGYAQAHFFAGIGGWSYALRQAGWTDDRPVWTGSCPCQPFSSAGKGKGYADERHLWPHWHRLISECRPAICFGEQVDAAIRTGWLDDVCLSLESLGYAVGAVSFPACGVGAPHIRQRLYFVADRDGSRCRQGRARQEGDGRHSARIESARFCAVDRMAYPAEPRRPGARQHDGGQPQLPARLAEHGCLGDTDRTGTGDGELQRRRELGRAAKNDGTSPASIVGNPDKPGLQEHRGEPGALRQARGGIQGQAAERAGAPTSGFWADAEWIACRDGKSRPVEPGVAPLASGIASRVVKLRGYGNSINAEAAKAFIEAYVSIAA